MNTLTEAVCWRCFLKKVSLENLQNSQESIVNFARFLEPAFLKEHLRWLLLH